MRSTYLCVSEGSVVISEHCHGSHEFNTRGVDGNDDHALLVVNVSGRIRFPHCHMHQSHHFRSLNRAGRIKHCDALTMANLQRGSIAPVDHHFRPLITYESPVHIKPTIYQSSTCLTVAEKLTISSDTGLNVGRIRRGNVRLCHQKAGADFTIQQWH